MSQFLSDIVQIRTSSNSHTALEVANEAARKALTGLTLNTIVKEIDSGTIYKVIDVNNLANNSGWSPVSGIDVIHHSPIEVLNSDARKGLGGLSNGDIVTERGLRLIRTLTVNFADTGGDTKTPQSFDIRFYPPTNLQYPHGENAPDFLLNGDSIFFSTTTTVHGIGYPDNSSANEIAQAINTAINTSPRLDGLYSSTVINNVVTFVKLVGESDTFQLIENDHAGFITLDIIQEEVTAGNTYELINNSAIYSDDSWVIMDIYRNTHLPFGSPILPIQKYAEFIRNFLDISNLYLASQGLTYIEPAIIVSNGLLQLNLGGNRVIEISSNLLNAENIDAILASLVGSALQTSSSFFLYIGGTDMGKPTPAALHQDAVLSLEFGSISTINISNAAGRETTFGTSIDASSGFNIQVSSSAVSVSVAYVSDPSVDFSATYTDSSINIHTVHIGTQDSPSNNQVADLIASDYNTYIAGNTSVSSSYSIYADSSSGSVLFHGGVSYGINSGINDWVLSGLSVIQSFIDFTVIDAGVIPGINVNLYLHPLLAPGQSIVSSNNVYIGARGVAADAIAAETASVIAGAFVVGISNPTSTNVTLVFDDESLYPLPDYTVGTASIAQVSKVIGTVFLQNANLQSLIDNGWHGNYKNIDGITVTF